MPGFSDYLEQAILNNCFAAGAIAGVSTVYLSLHSVDPTDAGTAGELIASSAGSYARAAATCNTTFFTTATESASSTSNAGYYIANNTGISFPQCTSSGTNAGGWGNVGWVGVWNHSSNISSGNFLYGAALSSTRSIGLGDVFKFNAGDLQIILR
jgi:hypothetical protein